MRTRLLMATFTAGLVAVMSTGALAAPPTKRTTMPTEIVERSTASEGLNCDGIGIDNLKQSRDVDGAGHAIISAVPAAAKSRIRPAAFAHFPSRAALKLDFIGADRVISEAPGLASAILPDVRLAVTTDGTTVQVLGSTERTGQTIVPLSINHRLDCEGAKDVRMTLMTEGVAIDAIDAAGHSHPVAWAGKPWAVDANGRELRTWYELDGTLLRQHIDASEAVAPITFDPTYSWLDCTGYFSDADAYLYMNVNADDLDWCPVMSMVTERVGYRPVYAFETNVANDYGKIVVKESGGCSWAPDTGASFDFQVPCKAHDYCYDLRKAGFSGTVSDNHCDDWFFWIMEAHCNNRVLANDCRSYRDSYWGAVSAPGVVTDPDPASMEISNFNSALCLAVEGGSTTSGKKIQQLSCNGTSSRLFKVTPANNYPGLFQLKAKHSGKCVEALNNGAQQWACNSAISAQLFEVRGAYNLNEYTLRPLHTDFTTCLDVPGSSKTSGVQIIHYSCFETDNQLWFIF